jgi:hypothetical protein
MIVFFKGKEYDLVNECIVDHIVWKYAIHNFYRSGEIGWYIKFNEIEKKFFIVYKDGREVEKKNFSTFEKNVARNKWINISKKELDKRFVNKKK